LRSSSGRRRESLPDANARPVQIALHLRQDRVDDPADPEHSHFDRARLVLLLLGQLQQLIGLDVATGNTGSVLTSDSRILTTHAGSLPRPAALAALHGRRSRGEDVDAGEFRRAVEESTVAVMAAQIEAGIDVGNDGEQARESFFTYVQHRMTGFGGTSERNLMRDLLDHPDYLELAMPRYARMKVNLMAAPAAIGDITYRDTAELDAECALVADAPFAETFMTSTSPGIVAAAMQNQHYPTRHEYVRAVAAALAKEYRAIVDCGLLLQIDAPDLALERHTLFAERPLGEFLEWVELVVDAINSALDGIDPGSVRLHVCWGNYEGPHTHDVALDDILPLLYDARVGALVLSMANARHSHEYLCFERRPLPDGMVLVSGVIDTTSNYVEHPEVVADRLVRVARAVGDQRRVIAGTDCGFETSAGIGDVAPSVVWAKLRALREGADLASARLF
jgi:5-methyltetrahydropteroyltriglutamate--homocysteine methyltransferase